MTASPVPSFTVSYNGIVDDLRSPAYIARTETEMNHGVKWTAIWDTGANQTVVSQNVIQTLGLEEICVQRVITSQGQYNSGCYYVDIGLPNKVVVKKVLVLEGNLSGFDMLIGMNIINRGDFVVTNNGRTVFSFRMPSLGEIDFVKNSYLEPLRNADMVGRNSLCPCGSGKKYKKCCGAK